MLRHFARAITRLRYTPLFYAKPDEWQKVTIYEQYYSPVNAETGHSDLVSSLEDHIPPKMDRPMLNR